MLNPYVNINYYYLKLYKIKEFNLFNFNPRKYIQTNICTF